MANRRTSRRSFLFGRHAQGQEYGANLGIRFGRKILHTEKIVLDRKAHASESGLARRIWAQKKIAELELRPIKHEDEITELGKEHSIVTRNTSLIVLDRLEDYGPTASFPEVDLRQQYFAKIEQQQKEKEKSREGRIAGVIKNEQRVAWWNKTFQFGPGKNQNE